jgi:integrase
MTGHVRRRGARSWELKFDVGVDAKGNRNTRYASFRGTKRDAQIELAKLVAAADAGTLPEPSKITVAQYLRDWLDGPADRPNKDQPYLPPGLAGKTVERYRQLAEQQIIPHLGAVVLQKLKPAHIADWHRNLAACGGKDGRPLSMRTVGHAHRVLRCALAQATAIELVSRNVSSAISPPKVEETEVESLKADEIEIVLAALKEHPLETIAVLAISSGARRGEILALTWNNVDLDSGTIKIERSLEQTKVGLRFKPPKTAKGKRTVSLPPIAVDVLRAHRRRQLELRMALGYGKPEPGALVFCTIDGDPIPPNNLSRDWRRFVLARKLPQISFHGLRHSHVSALIAGGVDVLTVSRRIGHAPRRNDEGLRPPVHRNRPDRGQGDRGGAENG